MAYRWAPTSEKPDLQLTEINAGGFNQTPQHAFNLNHNIDDQACPGVILDFLKKHGWELMMNHPDTGDPLFQKNDKGVRTEGAEPTDLTEGFYFFWYEAIAWEHYKLINIGAGE